MSEPAKDEAEPAEVLAMAMAIHFSMNRMPHMSGNPLNRLGVMERRRLDDATHAALAAIRAAGWAVVPVEPTREMLDAAERAYPDDGLGFEDMCRAEWAAMIAAAPGGVKP
jgi:hypothetical protein